MKSKNSKIRAVRLFVLFLFLLLLASSIELKRGYADRLTLNMPLFLGGLVVLAIIYFCLAKLVKKSENSN
jgi:hypothetical protein